eukprot:PITA_16909
MSLDWIPRGILHRIQQIYCRFLWNGSKEGRPFSWVKWTRIATPKKWGGWGIKLLPAFDQALAAKQSWLLLKQNSLWAEVILHKYIWPLTIMDWIRNPSWHRKGILVIWRAILNSISIIKDGLLWKIGNGASIRISIDPWIGSGNSHILPVGLIQHINNRDDWSRIWQIYLQALTETHVRLQNVEDELIWAHSKAGQYTPKQGYDIIIAEKKPEVIRSWWYNLWKLQAPPRTRLLMWNILEDKIPTGSYLKRRAFMGRSRCVLCLQEEESTQHRFLTCPTTRSIWTQVLLTLNMTRNWQGVGITMAWEKWWCTSAVAKSRNLPLLVPWYVWLKRNNKIFEDKLVNWNLLPPQICAAYEELPNDDNQKRQRIIQQEQINKAISWAYYDGASQQHGCGGGICLYLSETHYYHICLGLGPGTNNHAELITLCHLLYFAILKQCRNIQIFGDSKIVTD